MRCLCSVYHAFYATAHARATGESTKRHLPKTYRRQRASVPFPAARTMPAGTCLIQNHKHLSTAVS